ncbi:MAG: hypothetical protein KatS3mg076_2323 [Candidatus Binatia bacterium]|nr:MAG: hypothetical protein KatS3mg076_2323 [Candidatus Binatia bacterium]
MRYGSEAHKELFCRTFVETHDPYEPAALPWPDLPSDVLERLRSLPVWDEAVSTERETALKVRARALVEPDAVVREALALQAYEEERHSALLSTMTARYGIPVRSQPEPRLPRDPEWALLRVGYGECFDSFFAFGLFALARDSGYFPPELVRLFEPVMQEEARHILFFVNWAAFRTSRLPVPRKPGYAASRAFAIALQVASRIRTALEVGRADTQENFAMKSHTAFADVSVRSFLELCLAENERRLGPYDPRLLRPTLVPGLARALLRVLPDRTRRRAA